MLAATGDANDERDPGIDGVGVAAAVPAVSRIAGSDCGCVSTGRLQTAGTLAICFRNTLTLIVPGCSVAK